MKMGEEYTAAAVELAPLDLAIAAALVLVAGAVSVLFRLRLERRLAIASVRTVVQLLLIGYVLHWVFDPRYVLLMLPMIAVMILIAGRTAVERSSRLFAGVAWRSCLTLTCTGLITTVLVTTAIIGAEPWYRPQYFIPLLGMVLEIAVDVAQFDRAAAACDVFKRCGARATDDDSAAGKV